MVQKPDGWPFDSWIDTDFYNSDSVPLAKLMHEIISRYMTDPLNSCDLPTMSALLSIRWQATGYSISRR